MLFIMTPDDIDKTLEIPEWDTVSAIKPREADFIFQFVREKNLSHTLETGFAFARSAAHIIAATGSTHTVIDPFQYNYKNMGISNIEKLGLSEKLIFEPDFSHNVLPRLVKENKTFDFIFIDGDHKFDGIFIDFYYSNLLLEIGGFVMFHDTWMRSTRLVEKYIRRNYNNYRTVHSPLRNICIFEKIGNDNRDGIAFSEFYTFRSFFIYRLITWLSGGKKTALKKLLLSIKRRLIK